MTPGERLKVIRQGENLTQNGFAKKLGISQQALAKIENNKGGISGDLLRNLINIYKINPEWLSTGNGEKFIKFSPGVEQMLASIEKVKKTINIKKFKRRWGLKEGEKKILKVAEPQAEYGKKKIPLYDIEATASNIESIQDQQEQIKEYLLINYADCNFAINVRGNSMHPLIQSGDIVLCKEIKDREIIHFGDIYLLITSEYKVIKYLHKGSDNKHWKLISENRQEHEDFEIERDKILKLYLVKGFIRKNTM